jgi:putative membrane protein
MHFILRWLVTSLAVAAAVYCIPGLLIDSTVEAWLAIALVGLALAALNATIKPLLQLLSLPVTIITLGIFYLVVNTFMLYLASWIANGLFGAGFVIESFGSAFLGSIVISIVSAILNAIFNTDA